MKTSPELHPDGESAEETFHEVRTKLYHAVWVDLRSEARRSNVTVATLARIILSEWVRGRKGESKLV